MSGDQSIARCWVGHCMVISILVLDFDRSINTPAAEGIGQMLMQPIFYLLYTYSITCATCATCPPLLPFICFHSLC